MKERRQSHNRVDMTGRIYNYWKVLEPDIEKSKGKALYWKSECLKCKTVYSVWGANIRSGLSKQCAKCGNGHGHELQKGQIRTKRTPEESAYHYLYNQLKKGAKKRNLKWELTREQVRRLVTSSCAYSGHAPSLICFPLKHQGLSRKNETEAKIVRGGIDRVDSSKGYTMDNVVPCCTTCNTAKMSMSAEAFEKYLLEAGQFQLNKLKA